MWTEPFESTTVNHGSLDESIQALTDILSDEYDRYDGGGWYLATEEEIRNAIGYLKEYRNVLNTHIYIPEGYTRPKTGDKNR